MLKELRTKKETLMNTMRNILDHAEKEKRSLNNSEAKDFDGPRRR